MQSRARWSRRECARITPASAVPIYTGSVDSIGKLIAAKAGEDGLDDDDDAPAPQAPAAKKSTFDFSRWNLFGKSSLEDNAAAH